MKVTCTAALLLAFALPAAAQNAAPATPELQQMQAVEDAWDAAINKRDQYALENILAPRYIDISASGDVTTRNQQISHLFIQGAEPVSLKQTVIDAQLVGQVAVVNGTYVMEWREGSQKLAEKGVYTHVFARGTSGAWQCINSQRTVVADQDETVRAKRPETQKKSSAALPLHIPLVYKGPQSTTASGLQFRTAGTAVVRRRAVLAASPGSRRRH